MRRQIEDRNTRRSGGRLKIPCPEGEYPVATDLGQLSGHNSHGSDEVDVPVAGCGETKILDGPALPREVRQREYVVESVVKDACTANEPPESAQNGEAAVLPSSSPKKRTLGRGRRNKRGERPTLLPPARTNGKTRRISEANGMKRQANLTIEVPPLPLDWWAWEEISSPLTDDWLNSSSAMERTISRKALKHRSKKQSNKQPKEQSKKRPRGRPRRTRHLPTTNNLPLNHTLSQPPPSPNPSERHEQKKSAEERPQLTRKRNTSDRENVLEEDLVEDVPPSHGREHSSPAHLTRKVRFTSPTTVFPPLLSLVDQTDVTAEDDYNTPLLPWIKDFNLRGVESEHDPMGILGEPVFSVDVDWAVSGASTSCAGGSGEKMGDSITSDFREPTDAADGDPNFEALFGQCIRSPSPSPTPSS